MGGEKPVMFKIMYELNKVQPVEAYVCKRDFPQFLHMLFNVMKQLDSEVEIKRVEVIST